MNHIIRTILLIIIISYFSAAYSFAQEDDYPGEMVFYAVHCLVCRVLQLLFFLLSFILIPVLFIPFSIMLILIILYFDSKETKKRERLKIWIILVIVNIAVIVIAPIILLLIIQFLIQSFFGFTLDVFKMLLEGCGYVCGFAGID